MAGRPRTFDAGDALERAMVVFLARGFERASIDELSEATGVVRQSLYHTFGDKRTLFLKALDQYGYTRFQWLIDELGRDRPVMESIRAVLNGWADGVSKSGFKGCLVCNSLIEFADQDKEVAAICDKHNGRIEKAFRDAIARGKERGELAASIDERAVAEFFANLGQGLALQGRRGIQRQKAAEICAVAEAVLAG
ncbi:MAG: TetR/AcrR family transcriptional regulator [Phycisphaerales bacterium]|nr:TetR/AcrR family transcriptional regulator [Phycisphaerales bacterium]